MKLKDLESALVDLEGFRNPRIELEQYETQPHLAARTLFTIQQSFGDIEAKFVADLGCGPGRLSIGSSLLGADFVYSFDIDPSALDICAENCVEMEMANIEPVLFDVTSVADGSEPFPVMKGMFDTVISNPPFGTKSNRGVDVSFLKSGIYLSKHSVYSFHKSATRNFLLSKAKDWNVSMEVVAELKFDLPQTYKRHKKTLMDIEVDLIRTVHKATA